jgi:hypothetical protein
MTSFKAEDVKDVAALTKLLEQITADPSLVDRLPDDELLKIEHAVSPYGQVPEESANDKYSCISFTNLRKDYLEKMLMTAMVGYLFRRCNEFGRPLSEKVEPMDDPKAIKKMMRRKQNEIIELEGELVAAVKHKAFMKAEWEEAKVQHEANKKTASSTKMTSKELAELSGYIAVQAEVRERLRLACMAVDDINEKMSSAQAFGKRYIVKEFLDEQFKFDPDRHVRSSYMTKIRSKRGETVMSENIPPEETFHNFKYYLDSNHEEIRGVVEGTYGIKPDLDVMLQVHGGNFEGKEDADDYVERNQESAIASIISVKQGPWVVLEAFKENRDTIEAYRGTIVDDILERVKEEAQVGATLTRDRAVRRRTENIKKDRPDPAAVREYMKERAAANGVDESQMTMISAEDQEKIYQDEQDRKDAEEKELLNGEEKAPPGTLRVNVFKFSDGGDKLDKSHFLTKAKQPKDPASGMNLTNRKNAKTIAAPQ